jgi:MFS transporter, DHA3 family, macrolide efflux protein
MEGDNFMKSILKDKNFMLILCGKFVSLFGSSVYQIGLIWYVLSEYGEESGNVLAWIMILGILPSVLLGGVIGSFVDRLNKKWIIVVSDVASGMVVSTVVILMYFDLVNVAVLLTATAILSITESFVGISVTTMIPELYEEKKLYTANSANQFTDRVTRLLGLSIGGTMVGLLGVKNVFLITAVSFLLSSLSEVFIKYNLDKSTRKAMEKFNTIEDIKEVLSFVRGNRNVLMITILFSMVNLLWDPLLGIAFPYTLKNDFGITSGQFGMIEAALPAGFCIGAIYFSSSPSLLKGKDILFYSVLGANIMLFLLSLPILIGGVRGIGVIIFFGVSLLIMGLFSAAINISSSVAMQILVPQEIRGKYMGFSRSISMGLIPIGSAIVGALIGKVKPSGFFMVSILLVFLIVLVIPKKSYRIEKATSLSMDYHESII